MFDTAIAGSLPKPAWLAETQKLWPLWKAQGADLVCLCAIGRRYRPGYVREVVELTQPKWIVPCHWDTMVTPIDAPPEMLPGVDLPGFLREIEAVGVQALPVPLLGSLMLPRGPGA